MTIKPLIKSLSAIAGIGMVSIAAHAATTELTVYSAVEAEDLKKYAARFNQDHPDIKINWVRDSTGIVTAKLLAEKANPQADVVWGLAATSLMLLKNENMLESYKPKTTINCPLNLKTHQKILCGRAWTRGWPPSATTQSKPKNLACLNQLRGKISQTLFIKATS